MVNCIYNFLLYIDLKITCFPELRCFSFASISSSNKVVKLFNGKTTKSEKRRKSHLNIPPIPIKDTPTNSTSIT